MPFTSRENGFQIPAAAPIRELVTSDTTAAIMHRGVEPTWIDIAPNTGTACSIHKREEKEKRFPAIPSPKPAARKLHAPTIISTSLEIDPTRTRWCRTITLILSPHNLRKLSGIQVVLPSSTKLFRHALALAEAAGRLLSAGCAGSIVRGKRRRKGSQAGDLRGCKPLETGRHLQATRPEK